MTPNESALNEIHAAIDAGDGTDLIRDLARWVVQELLDAEALSRLVLIAMITQRHS